MRFLLVVTVALAVVSCRAEGAEITRVTYLLGGTMSGPYRLTADLKAGTITEGNTPAGMHPDQAPATTLPTTTERPLSSSDKTRIQDLAALVFTHGARKGWDCEMSPDALVRLEIAAGEQVKTFDLAAQCLTDDAGALQRAMYCAVHAGDAGSGCTAP